MSYSTNEILDTNENVIGYSIYCSTYNHCIPLDPANTDYQRVLDDIIEQGADCFEGDIPAEIQNAADAKDK